MGEIKVRSVVILLSGGQPMTVYGLGKRDDGTDVAFCSWMTEAGDAREHAFPLAALRNY